jgi:hypothetical protein
VDLTAQILLQIAAVETSTADLSATVTTTNVSRSLSFATGTGANQAQLVWSDSRTIAASGSDTLNLASLADDRGTVVLSAVKAIYIRNTGTAAITWAGGGWGGAPMDDASAGRLNVSPAGMLLMTNTSAAGWTVDASPQEVVLENASSFTATTYDILLIGEGSIV